MDLDLEGMQSLATTEVNIAGMLTLVLLIGALGALVWILKKPGGKSSATTDEAEMRRVLIETTRVLAETFGKNLGDELKAVMMVLIEDQKNTKSDHFAIINVLNENNKSSIQLAIIIERILAIITKDTQKIEEACSLIKTVTHQVNKVDKVVGVMNSEIEAIKQDLQMVQVKLDEINERISAGVVIDEESKLVMTALIAKMVLLDEKLDLVSSIASATDKTDREEKNSKTE